MAGHSKFKNIQHRKGAQDKKRAKIFTRILRDIATAVKGGQTDPEFNARLRHAIAAAKVANLPKDKIERAINATSEDDAYVEIRYEGFAPGGIAIIVETLTDNRNRTASEVRAAFSKHGGNLGETGSVSFMFDHVGIFTYPISVGTPDVVLDCALENCAIDVESDEEAHIIYSAQQDYADALDGLSKALGTPQESYVGWKPQNLVEVDDLDRATKLLKLINILEDNDDVQNVFGNYTFNQEVTKKLQTE